MERLISLFRALENEYEEFEEPQRRPEELPGLDGEPEYFVQLMEYLRERNDAARSYEHDEADEEKTVQTVGSHR